MIWFAPFQGLGDEDLIPRSSRATSASAQAAGEADEPADDQSRRSRASASTTA